jgi:Mg-chelatase subunit ChlI
MTLLFFLQEVPVEVSLELSREAVMHDHLENYKEINDAVQDRLIKQRELLAQYDIKKRMEEQQALIKHVRGLDGSLNIDATAAVEQPKKPVPSKEELRRRRETARALRKKHRLGRSRGSFEESGPDSARPGSGGGALTADEETMLQHATMPEDAPLTAEAIAQANAAAAEAKLRELLIPAMGTDGQKDGLQIDDDLISKFLVTYTFNEKGEKVMDIPMETKMAPLLRDKTIAIAYVKKQDSSEEILYR